jgi:hypothetical protein
VPAVLRRGFDALDEREEPVLLGEEAVLFFVALAREPLLRLAVLDRDLVALAPLRLPVDRFVVEPERDVFFVVEPFVCWAILRLPFLPKVERLPALQYPRPSPVNAKNASRTGRTCSP